MNKAIAEKSSKVCYKNKTYLKYACSNFIFERLRTLNFDRKINVQQFVFYR